MAFDFSSELVATQRAFFEAQARCEEIAATHPRSTDVAAGTAEITDGQHAELAAARAKRLQLVEQLAAHWATVNPDERTAARAALREAARG